MHHHHWLLACILCTLLATSTSVGVAAKGNACLQIDYAEFVPQFNATWVESPAGVLMRMQAWLTNAQQSLLSPPTNAVISVQIIANVPSGCLLSQNGVTEMAPACSVLLKTCAPHTDESFCTDLQMQVTRIWFWNTNCTLGPHITANYAPVGAAGRFAHVPSFALLFVIALTIMASLATVA